MKGLRWDDEPYVKLYTRDTPAWLTLSFEARGLFCLLMRAVDRSGQLLLGDDDHAQGVALFLRCDYDVAQRGLGELLKRGFAVISGQGGGTVLVLPEFVVAQEARKSDAVRARESRARARDKALSTPPADVLSSQNVTPDPQNVTRRHTPSHAVTNRSDQIRSDQTRSDEKRSDPSPTGEGVQGGNQGLEDRTQRIASPPTDRCPVSAAQPPARSQGSVQLAIPETIAEEPPRKSQTPAKPKAAAKPKKPAPLPPPSPKPLTDAERIVAEAIREDETLGRITRNIEQFARDLVRCCPLVDLVLEIRNLGAYTRTPKGLAKRYTDGNAFLLNNLRRRQEEQAERQAHLEAIKPPPAPKKTPPPDDYVPPWKREGYKKPAIPAGDFETVFPQLLANIGFKVPPPNMEPDFDGFENLRVSGS